MPEEKKTIESLLEEIEDIVSEMEKKDITLEESFALYEDGARKLKEAGSLLDEVAKRVELLDAEGEPEGELELVEE